MHLQFNKGVLARIDDLLQRPSMIDMTPNEMSTRTDLAYTHPHTIDMMQVRPQPGQLYHLSGPGRTGRSMRPIAEQWIAWALVRGQMVHWVDGACRVDPSRLIPLLETLGGDVEACLSRFYLSRGFTLHQLDKQLERLSDELTITRAPLLVVDGLLAMHEDDAIRRIESRYLLRRHLGLLERLVQKHNTAVLVITQSHSACPLHQRRIRSVHRCAQNHLVGMWKGTRRRRELHLHHLRTGIQGRWLPRRESQTCFRIKPRTSNEQRATIPAGALPLLHEQE